MPEKMKRLFNCIVPVSACNFKCHYCYIGQTDGFKGEIRELPYSLEFIAHALRPERIGEHCHINLCGSGETLLAPYVVELTRQLTQIGHYCTIVTNGVLSARLNELLALPAENLKRVFVKFSFHFLELTRQNLLERFWENVKKVKEAGCAFTIELTVNDESVAHISEIQKSCAEHTGALCHVIESRDNRREDYRRLTRLQEKEHQNAWSAFESSLFDFQQTIWGEKRREFCYAGDWVTSFYLETGDVYTCFAGGKKIGNLYENTTDPFPFVAVGSNCPWAHCFAAHVLLTSGAIPNFPAPTYAQIRDRVCVNGDHWLTSDFSAFFGSRFCESNSEYSSDKQDYINALMAAEYNNVETEIDFAAIGKIVKEHLNKRRIYTTALYGGGAVTDFLCRVLNSAGMPPLFCIDSDFVGDVQPDIKERAKRLLRYRVRNYRRTAPSDLIWLTCYDWWPRVDAVIIPDHAGFYEYRRRIKKIAECKIVSSIELVE